MPRDSGGNYTLPEAPVQPATPIESTVENNTNADIAAELTDSLSRTGKGGMLAALGFADGTLTAPGIAFNDELNTGLYRESAGSVIFSVLGVGIEPGTGSTRWSSTAGFQVWDAATWNTVVFNPPIDGILYGRQDGVWVATFTKTDADLLYAPLVHTHVATDVTDFDTEVSNNTTVAANAADIVTMKGTPYTTENLVDHEGRITALESSSGIPDPLVAENIKNKGYLREAAASVTTTVDTATGRHFFTTITGPVTIDFLLASTDADLDPDYIASGTVMFTNSGASVTESTLQVNGVTVGVEDIKGTQPTGNSDHYLLRYYIHRHTGPTYEYVFVWDS